LSWRPNKQRKKGDQPLSFSHTAVYSTKAAVIIAFWSDCSIRVFKLTRFKSISKGGFRGNLETPWICHCTELVNRDTIGLKKLTCIRFTAISENFLVVVNHVTHHTSALLACAVKAGTPFQMIFDYGGSLVSVQGLGCHWG